MFTRAVILAAGRGSRMGKLSDKIPKPLLPRPSNSMLKRQIDWLKGNQIEIWISVGYKKEKVIEFADKQGIKNYIDTENRGNASSLSVLNSMNRKDPWIIITCDNILTINLEHLYHDYIKVGLPGMIIPVKSSESISGDRILADKNLVTGISKNIASQWIASGMQIIDLSKIELSASTDLDFNDVWNEMIINRQLAMSNITPESWVALDVPNSLSYLSS